MNAGTTTDETGKIGNGNLPRNPATPSNRRAPSNVDYAVSGIKRGPEGRDAVVAPRGFPPGRRSAPRLVRADGGRRCAGTVEGTGRRGARTGNGGVGSFRNHPRSWSPARHGNNRPGRNCRRISRARDSNTVRQRVPTPDTPRQRGRSAPRERTSAREGEVGPAGAHPFELADRCSHRITYHALGVGTTLRCDPAPRQNRSRPPASTASVSSATSAAALTARENCPASIVSGTTAEYTSRSPRSLDSIRNEPAPSCSDISL